MVEYPAVLLYLFRVFAGFVVGFCIVALAVAAYHATNKL